MTEQNFGTERLSAEDRSYRGSRFSELVDALFANPYQRVWGGAAEPPLPVYEVTFASVTHGIAPGGSPHVFQDAAARTVDSGADLRWGPDRKGFRRLLHPNGVCLIGNWHVTEETPYSGYFAKDSRGLLVARYSTCCTETHRGQIRSLALVGKIYPTTDPNHAEPLQTANFITQEDIGGNDTAFINDAELRNAPDTTASRRAAGLPILLTTGLVFNHVDKQPSIRQLYPIAELGLAAGKPTHAPTYMRLLVAPNQPRIAGDAIDFRDEVLAQIFDRGDPAPKRTLVFNIEVTDDGQTSGPAVKEQRTFKNWRHIGTLTFNNGVASYNGDCVIHFNHPTWRDDQNDRATATRVKGEKVR
jgi:hypothetical protein